MSTGKTIESFEEMQADQSGSKLTLVGSLSLNLAGSPRRTECIGHCLVNVLKCKGLSLIYSIVDGSIDFND